jgi:hypothetical protein
MTAAAPLAPVARAEMEHLDNGRKLTYPGDAWLEKPVVIYNPHHMSKRFKVFQDEMPVDADPRVWRPRRFVPEQWVRGRFLAYTELQLAAARRVCGQNADRWTGDDLDHERVCPQESCRFATRNRRAYDDHEQFTERHRPAPDLSRFY